MSTLSTHYWIPVSMPIRYWMSQVITWILCQQSFSLSLSTAISKIFDKQISIGRDSEFEGIRKSKVKHEKEKIKAFKQAEEFKNKYEEISTKVLLAH